jgi:hypothetical protein
LILYHINKMKNLLILIFITFIYTSNYGPKDYVMLVDYQFFVGSHQQRCLKIITAQHDEKQMHFFENRDCDSKYIETCINFYQNQTSYCWNEVNCNVRSFSSQYRPYLRTLFNPNEFFLKNRDIECPNTKKRCELWDKNMSVSFGSIFIEKESRVWDSMNLIVPQNQNLWRYQFSNWNVSVPDIKYFYLPHHCFNK